MALKVGPESAGRLGKVTPRATTPLLTGRVLMALVLIVLLGAVLRLVVILHAPAFTGDPDTVDYFAAGYQLVYSGEFPLNVKRAPLYSLFLAGLIMVLGPNLEAITAVQHLFGLVSVTLVYFIGALVFGRAVGLLAAFVTAINGALLLMEHTALSEAILTPLLLASLLALLVAFRGRQRLLFVLTGLGLGLAALTRPAVPAFLPVVLGAICLWSPTRQASDPRSRWAPRLVAAGLVVLGFGLIVGPWTIRNRMTHGLVTTSGGLGDALFARTHRHDQTFTYHDRGEPTEDREAARIRKRVFELSRTYRDSGIRRALQSEFGIDDAQSDAALRDVAIQVIRQEPGRYISGTVRMFVALGLGFEKPLKQYWATRTKAKRTVNWPESLRFVAPPVEEDEVDFNVVESVVSLYQDYMIGGLIGLLFLVGAIRCAATGWHSGALLLPLIAITQILVHVALEGPIARYRFPVQPLITLVAIGGLGLLTAQALGWLGRLRPLAAGLVRSSDRLPSRVRAPDTT
jgi:hypothetical protein